MSLFSALFGKKKNEVAAVKITTSIPTNTATEASPSFHLRGKPDSNGLYPSELVMLAVAERYKTTETNFSNYFLQKYEIANAPKMLKSLHSRGFLEIGSPVDMLPSLKVPELKELAAAIGVAVKGKKADIIATLSEVDSEVLANFINDRKWKLTSQGQTALHTNPYIQYFLDTHSYDLASVGITIWSVNQEYLTNPNQFYRDVIYRQLNARMNEAALAFQKNPASGSADTHQYCECQRLMGLFIEEEGKSYVNASDMYFRYLYNWINVHAGRQLLVGYKLFSNDKAYQKELIGRYYNDIQLYPFQRTELLRLIDELGIDNDAVKNALITSFKRADVSGIMTEKEAADFILYELTGETEKAQNLAEKLAKNAVKRIK